MNLSRLGAALKAFRLVFGYGGGYSWGGGPYGGGSWDGHWGPLPGTRYDYAAEAGELTLNSSVQACLAWMQKTFPEPRLKVVRQVGEGDDLEEVKGHVLTKLLRRPNPFYSGDDLWQRTIPDFITRGNAYWVKIRNGSGEVIQLWHRPARLIRPVRDRPTDYISRYLYSATGATGSGGMPEQSLPIEDVIHFRFGYNPEQEMLGWSPLFAGLREVATLNNGATYRGALLREMGVPAYALVPTDREAAEDLQARGKPAAQSIREMFRSLFAGDGAGRLFIPTFPANLARVGFSPQELDIKDLLEWDSDMICALIGLNSMVVGLPAGEEHRTFANFESAREAAFESNIIPTQKLMAEALSLQLLPDLGDPDAEEVTWDYSKVRVLQGDLLKERIVDIQSKKEGILETNEVREKWGFKPLTPAQLAKQEAAKQPPAFPPGPGGGGPPESRGDARARDVDGRAADLESGNAAGVNR